MDNQININIVIIRSLRDFEKNDDNFCLDSNRARNGFTFNNTID